MARSASASLVLPALTSAAALAGAIIDRISEGILVDGDRLPSTRSLALQTGLTRGTVVRAFDELAAAGFVVAVQGSATRISEGAAQAARAGARTRGSGTRSAGPAFAPRTGRCARDLRPGIPDAGLVEQRAWRSAVRAAVGGGLAGLNPWEEPSPRLREQLSEHLRRHRGIAAADPLLFDSSRSAVAALCAAFAAAQPDESSVLFHTEDPGYRGAVLMAREQGLTVRFHRAEPDGLRAAELGDDPAIVFTTPAHQYPMGFRMSVDRRVELTAWAQRTGSLIIEDDYDGEFRYGVAPLPALSTLDIASAHVAYVGTSSKSVAPDLRVAWCVPPTALRRSVQRWLAVHRRPCPRTRSVSTSVRARWIAIWLAPPGCTVIAGPAWSLHCAASAPRCASRAWKRDCICACCFRTVTMPASLMHSTPRDGGCGRSAVNPPRYQCRDWC